MRGRQLRNNTNKVQFGYVLPLVELLRDIVIKKSFKIRGMYFPWVCFFINLCQTLPQLIELNAEFEIVR